MPRRVVVASTVVWGAFVAAWVVVGMARWHADDSRFGFGMFPYVLTVDVADYRFLHADGSTTTWQPPAKGPRLPRPFRPHARTARGGALLRWGYGLGAYRDVVDRILVRAARAAPRDVVAVEARYRYRVSERPWLDEVRRRAIEPREIRR